MGVREVEDPVEVDAGLVPVAVLVPVEEVFENSLVNADEPVIGLVVPEDLVPVEGLAPVELAGFFVAGRAPTLREGVPMGVGLQPSKASFATVSAVGRFSGERYLQPANARAPMLDSPPST